MFKDRKIIKKLLPALLCAIIVVSLLPLGRLTTLAEVVNNSKATPVITNVEGAASGVQINWGKVTGAEKYRVFYKTGTGDWTYITDTTATSYTWTGAKVGTKYTFTVRCVSRDGKSYTSNYDHAGTVFEYTATPKLTSVKAVTSGIQIDWGKVTGAAKYRIFYRNSNGGWTKIADTTSTSYIWTGAATGTKYTFTVRCLSSDGKRYTGWFDTVGMGITYVSTPKISYVEGASSGISINWGKVTGAEKYRVFYKTGTGDWTYITDTTATSTTWTGAKSGTNYAFTVRCVSSDGKSYTSDYDHTGTSLGYTSTPKLTSVKAVTSGIQIDWGKVAGAAKYRVFYRNGNGGWTKITDTTSTSYTWSGAKVGTKYTFTVRCINSAGTAYTSWFDTVGLSVTCVSTPKISHVESTGSGIQIHWGKVSGAEKYRVFYKTASSDWIIIADTAATSYNWTGAKSGTKYTFTVRGVSSNGKSYTSDYDHTGTAFDYVAAPKLASVKGVTSGIQIDWGNVAGAAKYRVFYKIGGGAWTKIADTSATSYTWSGAKAGTKYTFTVRCINSAGTAYTSWFDTVGLSITYASAPKVLSAVTIATGTLITWEKSAGAEKYRVFYKTDSSDWIILTDTTSTQYTWKGAKSGVKYTFTVRCITSNGKTYTSSYDSKGVTQSTTFTTSKGYQGVVKNGVVYIDGYLIANKTYPLPSNYGNGITSTAQSAFNKMKEGAKKDGISLWIQSGYRSYSYQNTIYNNYCKRDGQKEADTYSARPGYSEHQSGLAMDLNVVGNAFNGSKEAKWLEKNCYKYGFILRYPKGKTNETGYVYESWHFRYVGEDLAKKLYNNGDWITMEDYFGFTSQYN